MNKDEIIRMAREAGFGQPYVGAMKYELKRFAALVAAHEREACAKVCDEKKNFFGYQCAAAIRARGEK